MILSRCFATLLIMNLGCHVGCAPSEEDIADVRQSSDRTSDEPPDTVYPDDANRSPMVFPIAIMTPMLNVDPYHAWNKELAQFVITNPTSMAHMIGTLVVGFGQLCPLLETVSLLDEQGVMSDGDCHEEQAFTIDEILPAYAKKRVSVWAQTKTGFAPTLAAIRMKHANPQTGIRPLALTLSRGMILFDELMSGPPIIVQDVTREDESECSIQESADQTDTLSMSFQRDEQHRVIMAQNTGFLVPFDLVRPNPGLETTGVIIKIRTESLGVTIASGEVLTANDHRNIDSVTEYNGALILSISAADMERDTHFLLNLHAPGNFGVIRFAMMPSDVRSIETLTFIGCYPNMSDTYLVLPANEINEGR